MTTYPLSAPPRTGPQASAVHDLLTAVGAVLLLVLAITAVATLAGSLSSAATDRVPCATAQVAPHRPAPAGPVSEG